MLFVAVGLVVVGLAVAGVAGGASITSAAPAVARASDVPADAPPILPFLFITIACGAVSGFHSLVSSGTSSKQLARETDARAVGFGSMLVEGALAVVVIIACTAGLGMGLLEQDAQTGAWTSATNADGVRITGADAWHGKYPVAVDPATGRNATRWAKFKLPQTVGAFVEGGANFLHAIGIPLHFAVLMLGVMVACFAATTLDTATRLQRYVVQEIGATVRVKPLQNKYVATGVAVLSGLAMAVFAGPVPGAGGMILWPMFGATNQVLAGLGFLVVGFYLIRRGKPIWFLVGPAALMLALPAWAMLWQMFNADSGWLPQGNWLLLAFGAAVQLLVLWIVIEAVIAWRNAKREGLASVVPPMTPAAPVTETVRE
jgi:carbon starvation protein